MVAKSKVYCTNFRDHDISPWQYHVHPEGQPYYRLEPDTHHFSYNTDADITVSNVRTRLNRCIEEIEKRAEIELDSCHSDGVDVVLSFTNNEWTYYMVNTVKRRVFWLDEFDLGELTLGPYEGIEKQYHFRTCCG